MMNNDSASNTTMGKSQAQHRKRQYAEWTERAIKELQQDAMENVQKRIPLILAVCNETCTSYAFRVTALPLILSKTEVQRLLSNIKHEIGLWHGIKAGSCKTEKAQYADYRFTARNWFNRHKGRIYGTYLFHPLIFDHIYRFITGSECGGSPRQKILLFLDILHAILHCTVQYPKCKALPLIPLQTFIQENAFKDACFDLCEHYQVDWKVCQSKRRRLPMPDGNYAKNSNRSMSVHSAFVGKIEEIKASVQSKCVDHALPSLTRDRIRPADVPSSCAFETNDGESVEEEKRFHEKAYPQQYVQNDTNHCPAPYVNSPTNEAKLELESEVKKEEHNKLANMNSNHHNAADEILVRLLLRAQASDDANRFSIMAAISSVLSNTNGKQNSHAMRGRSLPSRASNTQQAIQNIVQPSGLLCTPCVHAPRPTHSYDYLAHHSQSSHVSRLRFCPLLPSQPVHTPMCAYNPLQNL